MEKQISGSGVVVDFAEKLESLPDKARLLVGDMLSYIAQAGVKLTKWGMDYIFLINKWALMSGLKNLERIQHQI